MTTIRKPSLANEAIKQINTASTNAKAKVSLTGKTAEALGNRLEKLAHSQPALAYGLIVYMHELKEGGRLNFKDAGRIPSPSSAQGNAWAHMVDGAKIVLNANALISDDMKVDLIAK